MTTQETVRTNIPHWKNVKEEYDERQLIHTCFRCSARYSTSSMLMQHMKIEHPSLAIQPATETEVITKKLSASLDGDRYKNAIATCPFCKQDCQTRKKLMRHLELEHKDDNDQDEDNAVKEPNVKVIRIDEQHTQKLLEELSQNQNVTGPFVTPGASGSKMMVHKLLKVIGSSNSTLTIGNTKMENKSAAKLQYKCFWCDASFRKRGKLMDHIDTLHKHNKQQTQAEADMLNMDSDSNKQLHGRHLTNHRSTSLSQLELPSYLPGLSYASAGSNQTLPRHSPSVAADHKNAPTGNATKCSFTLVGSLTKKLKSSMQEEQTCKQNRCKFYLGKKDNPMANMKINSNDHQMRESNQRRFSLPNLFDGTATSSPYNFPYGMLPSNSMAAVMQHNYMMNMRPPLLNATQFYAPRMPMMMPSSEYMVSHAHPIMDHHTQNSPAQLLARINAMAQISPLARPKAAESPLDLTKSYV